MKIIKKSNLFIPSLMIATTMFTMDEPPQPKKKKPQRLIANIAGQLVVGNAPTQELTHLFARSSSEATVSLATLPNEIQQRIIIFFITPITYAGKTINAFAQTNKQYNHVINQRTFSFQLLKSLSHRFNRDNETVCECMQTKETQRLLSLQRTLRNLCIEPRTTLKTFIDVRLQGTDLNFTYKNGMTLLLFCLNNDDFRTLGYLLQKGADPNLMSPGGTTPLIHSILFGFEHIVHLLLSAGADPELEDSTGVMTPYGIAGFRNNERLMRLIAAYMDQKRKKNRALSQ